MHSKKMFFAVLVSVSLFNGISITYLIQITCTQFHGLQYFCQNTNNYMVASNYFYLIITECQEITIWF